MTAYRKQEVTSASSIKKLLKGCPDNQIIRESLIQTWEIINNPQYKKILCSISGGSDSDVMLDMVFRCDRDKKVDYAWYDTGLEYQATKDHLNDLQKKYGIVIKPHGAIKPIPASCKEHGQPFLNKRVSEYIYRLQRYDFQWEDEPYEKLIKKYPHCQSALKWWCNANEEVKGGMPSRFNIDYNKYLKEFMVKYPPWFCVSCKCCHYAKENVSNALINMVGYDISIVGVRKAEGGARATAYNSCLDSDGSGCINYRPLLWYKNEDKEEYSRAFGIWNSRCYSLYGLKRTGCAGCPYGRDFDFELESLAKYEPELYWNVTKTFGDSYVYTRMYREFKNDMSRRRCA